MSPSQGSTSTFEEYTFDLRNGLREAARVGLSQLEEMIIDVGYGWLDGYMDSIMEVSSSKAPITDLMKTPSRTQTTRKTRGATATAKARSKKATGTNQKLAKSTSAPSPLAATRKRSALSPLNPQTFGNVLSTPAVSPSKGKGKAGKAAKSKKAEEKPAKRKAADKKKAAKGTVIVVEPGIALEQGLDAEPSVGLATEAMELDDIQPLGIEERSEIQPQVSANVASSKGSIPMASSSSSVFQAAGNDGEVEPACDEDVHVEAEVNIEAKEAETVGIEGQDKDMDEAGDSAPEDGEPEAELNHLAAVPASPTSNAESAPQKRSQLGDSTDDEEGKTTASPEISGRDDIELDLPAPLPTSPIPATLGASRTQTSPLPVPAPATSAITPSAVKRPDLPVRQVRSSWLSKALGTGTVPVHANDAANARKSVLETNLARKSVMAHHELHPRSVALPSQQRASTVSNFFGDLAAARKSLVQPISGVAKRKSEEAASDAEHHVEDNRPGKMAKISNPVAVHITTTSNVAQQATTSIYPAVHESLFSPPIIEPARKFTPFGRPKESTSGMTVHFPLPATTPAHTAQPNQPSASQEKRSERNKSDIYEVTRKLEELRERTAAKEASKIKAQALAMSGSNGSKSSLDSKASAASGAAGGFFRGLGRSLGLGGNAKSAEDEALKLQRELEEDRRAEKDAEREYQRLMDEARAEGAAAELGSSSIAGSQEQSGTTQTGQRLTENSSATLPQLEIKKSESGTAQPSDANVLHPAAAVPQWPSQPVMERELTPSRQVEVPSLGSTTPAAAPPTSISTILQRIQVAQTSNNGAHTNAQENTANVESHTSGEIASPNRTIQAVEVAPGRPATPTRSMRFPPVSPEPTQKAPAPPRPAKSPERSKRVPMSADGEEFAFSRSPEQAARSQPRSPAPFKTAASQPIPVQPKIQTQSHAVSQPAEQATKRWQTQRNDEDEDEDEASEDDADLPDLPEPNEADDEQTDVAMEEEERKEERNLPASKMFNGDPANVQRPNITKSSSSQSLAPSLAISTASSSDMLNRASTIAGKTLGFKPTTGPVRSLALAASAAKKEQAALDRKMQIRDQLEQRKAQAATRKAEEDRLKSEEEKRLKLAEFEEKRRHRGLLEKQRKEREERQAANAKEKAVRKEEEAAAATRVKAEQEAARKRKLLQAGTKAVVMPPMKKIAVAGPQAPMAAQSVPLAKPKGEPMRVIKPTIDLSSGPSSAALGPAQKVGPTHFRSISTNKPDVIVQLQQSSSTISLVQTQTQVERPPLGPPSRPAAQPIQNQAQTHAVASAVLQKSRINLKAQIDQNVIEVQSEDIELPDIASEYSDSDDSEKETDFKPPQWAESPELRQALQQQAYRDPDELFGPIKPVNMEELFKVRVGKFRARSSSANWHATGDRLTKVEEVEYARRMGFKPIGSGVRAVGSAGSGVARPSQLGQ